MMQLNRMCKLDTDEAVPSVVDNLESRGLVMVDTSGPNTGWGLILYVGWRLSLVCR